MYGDGRDSRFQGQYFYANFRDAYHIRSFTFGGTVDPKEEKLRVVRTTVSSNLLLPHQKKQLVRFMVSRELKYFAKYRKFHKNSLLDEIELTKNQKSAVKKSNALQTTNCLKQKEPLKLRKTRLKKIFGNSLKL